AQERARELNSHLMLFYTGIKRTASNIAESYVNGIEDRKRQLRIMKDLVEESLSILNNGEDIAGFGELLHEAWQAKRSLSSKVSNSYVDEIYEQAMAAGAIGGKLIGAGGGGFLLLFVPPADQDKVREKLNKLICVPFKFESSGSQIIFLDREEDYSAEDRARANQSIEAFQELTHSSI
ncbi:MAG: kinase, partial [Candidatus Tectomicrobia bacterium]|nr:kinase [Candidatus Tectomicrobia bacterium]